MERGTSGSRRENTGKEAKRLRYVTQLGENLLFKQPALDAVVYRTRHLLKTPYLSAVMTRLPRVQFHHQSRCLNCLQDTCSAP